MPRKALEILKGRKTQANICSVLPSDALGRVVKYQGGPHQMPLPVVGLPSLLQC